MTLESIAVVGDTTVLESSPLSGIAFTSGTLTVSSGGVIQDTTIGTSGIAQIFSGGLASSVELLNSGQVVVASGGTVSGACVVYQGGTVSALSGSVLSGTWTMPDSGGSILLMPGANTSGLVISGMDADDNITFDGYSLDEVSFSLTETGQLQVTSGGTIVQSIQIADVGSERTLSISAPDRITVTLQDAESVSLSSAISDVTATEGVAYSRTISASSFVASAGGTLTYSATQSDGSALPSWLTFDASTRILSGTPPAGAANYTIRVKATSPTGGFAYDDFVLTTAASPVTVATALTDRSVTKGTAFTYTVSSSAFQTGSGIALSYSAQLSSGASLPSWLTFNASTRTLSGTPPASAAGSYTVRITATNAGGGTAYDDFILRTTTVPVTVATSLSDQTATEGQAFSLTIPSTNFVSVGQTLTYSATLSSGAALPSWLTFNASTRVLAGTAPVNTSNYTIRITATNATGVSAYDDFILTTPGTDPGNSLTSSYNLGSLTTTATTYTDTLGLNGDTGDVLKFTATRSARYSILLNGMTANANFTLMDSNGIVIASSSNSGTTADQTVQTLAAGTYYVRVSPATTGTNTEYQLSLRQLSTDGAGNTASAARSVGTLPTSSSSSSLQTTSITDWVGLGDTQDYYTFSLDNQATVYLTMSGLAESAGLTLYDSSQTQLATASQTGTSNRTLSQRLSAGTYTVKVSGTVDTSYTLALGSVLVDIAGNSLSKAKSIGALAGGTVSYADQLSSTDTDFYQFTLSSKTRLTLALSGMTANGDLALLSSSGAVLQSSRSSGSQSESLTRTLEAGTYYVKVSPGESSVNTSYSLSAQTTLLDTVGNTISTALNKGTLLASTLSLRDSIGGSDTADYYRFTTTLETTLSLTTSGVSGSFDLGLFNSSGSSLTSTTVTTSGGSLTRLLAAGTYYVAVSNPSSSTSYTVTLATAPTDNAPATTSAVSSQTSAQFGTLSTSATSKRDYLGASDTIDIYGLSIANASAVQVTLSNLSLGAEVRATVLASNGTTVISSDTLSVMKTAFNTSSLASGSYFLRLVSTGQETSYNASLKLVG